MKKDVFPPEIIEFTAEHHFAKNDSRSKIVYQIFVVSILLILLALPFIEIDISTQCLGIVRTPNENNKLQAAVYGEVSRINMDENHKVKKGDTLLILRTDKIDEQIASAKTKKADNQRNIGDIDLLMSNKMPKGYKYLSEHNELVTKKNELTTQVLYSEREFSRSESLFRKNVLSESDYLLDKNKYEMALKLLDLSLNEYRNRWQADRKRMELENIDITSTIEQLQKEKRNYSIVAFADGAIIQSAGLQVRSFITPGQIVGYLSEDNNLIAECYVKPSDIGYIKLNQKVEFQFDAFNYREWGVVAGKVVEISNDIVTLSNNQSAFRVRCQLQKKSLTLRNGYIGNIKKGMTITGQFYLTRRTLAQLLFDKMDDWMNPKLIKKQ